VVLHNFAGQARTELGRRHASGRRFDAAGKKDADRRLAQEA